MGNDILYDYWWASLQNGYLLRAKEIAEQVESTRVLYELEKEELIKLHGISERTAEYIYSRKKDFDMEREYEKLEKLNIRFLTYKDADYPRKLKELPSHPFAIFVKGELPKEGQANLAVIGARECSEYGKKMAFLLGDFLGSCRIDLTSGMAYGIDGIAQMAALDAKGISYGVLGCGVDVVYPPSNKRLYERLCEEGGVISEYPPGTKPLARLFPPRNRIISALSDAVIVVEAKERSGTQITVDMALEQGREVYAVPGRMTDRLSLGCNQLIKQGAIPLTSLEDLLIFAKEEDKNTSAAKHEKKLVLEREEELVYSVLDLYAKRLEEISSEISCSVPELLHILVSLECKGLVKEVSKNYYVKI